MNRRSTIGLVLGMAMLVIPSCGPDDLAGPPTIRVGRDECAGCGMLVSEERSSCALLVEQGGRRAHVLFDDPGCLLDYRAEHPEATIVATFVHDHTTGDWLDGAAAAFLLAPPGALRTPMGSGIAAFATPESAAAQRARSGGETADFQRLIGARRAWKESQLGPRPTPDSASK